jgi:plasmid maintenance system antidote protein VapI
LDITHDLPDEKAMTEIEMLRDWLARQAAERKLNEIARQTGVNRRTIQRIVNNDKYSVTSTTSSALKRYMDTTEREAEQASV